MWRRIQAEVANLKKTKKFGLVFEPQNPECVPLYTVPVKKNSLVTLKSNKINETFRVNEYLFFVRIETSNLTELPLNETARHPQKSQGTLILKDDLLIPKVAVIF